MAAERPSVAVDVAGVSKSFDGTVVLDDVSLHVEAGAMVALLGPSGCGKTTLLRIIAGLEPADVGEVRVGDRLLTGAGTAVPPERRQVGMVFQDWALFPHLNVARNVAYGLTAADDRGDRVELALAMVGLDGLGDRMPSTLSGGQQQRVALARAVAPEPTVLLLDEPFSNLDTSLRVQVRSEVHELLVRLGITTIFVTHDQEEAFVLGDDVAVMSGGRIVQHGAPAEIYRRPATSWVAGFVGEANLVPGELDAGTGTAGTIVGRVPVDLDPRPDDRPRAVEVLLRPEQLTATRAPADGGEPVPGDTGVPGVIGLVEYHGHDTMYLVDVGGTQLRVRDDGDDPLARGTEVTVRFVGSRARAFAAGAVDAG